MVLSRDHVVDYDGEDAAAGDLARAPAVDGRYVGFVPGRRGVRSEPALYAGLKERSQVK